MGHEHEGPAPSGPKARPPAPLPAPAQEVRGRPPGGTVPNRAVAAALQRQVGNQRLLRALGGAGSAPAHPVVQRVPGVKKRKGKVLDPNEVLANVEEQKSGAVGTTLSGAVTESTFRPDPNAAPGSSLSDHSTRLGVVGTTAAGLQGVFGMAASGMAVHAARGEMGRARAAGDENTVRYRVAERSHDIAAADVAKHTTTTATAVGDAVAKGLNVGLPAGEQAANIAGAVAGGAALPLSLFNVLRDARKAHKARQRVVAIEGLLKNWERPRANLQELEERFKAHEELLVAAEERWEAAKAAKAQHLNELRLNQTKLDEVQNSKTANKRTPLKGQGVLKGIKAAATNVKVGAKEVVYKERLWELERAAASLGAAVQADDAEMDAAKQIAQEAVQGKQEAKRDWDAGQDAYAKMLVTLGSEEAQERAEKARGKGSGVARSEHDDVGRPSLLEIQAYALQKNQAGVIKKAMSAAGGLLATGAGAAAFAVALAAAGVGTVALMATPIGWGLAAAAAAVGVGLAGYKAFVWLRKRYAMAQRDASGNPVSKGKALVTALQVWKPAGRSRRERYGTSLLEMALGDLVYPSQQKKADALVKGLTGQGVVEMGLGSLVNPTMDPDPAPELGPPGAAPQPGNDRIDAVAHGATSIGERTKVTNAGATPATGASKPLKDLKEAAKKQKQGTPMTAEQFRLHAKYKAAKDLIATKMGS